MAPPSDRAKIMAALPGTIHQLVARSGSTEATIRRHLKRARKDGQSHIGRWIRTVGALTPFHMAGPGVDAPKPPARTPAAYCRIFRRRQRRALAKLAPKRKVDPRRIVIPTTKQSIFAPLGL